jgi:glucosylglycerate synthase
LLQRIMPGIGAFRAGTSRIHPIASLTPEAVIAGLPVCQSHVGVRAYATPDWTGLGALLAQILGPLFIDIERHAAAWQRIRGSQRVPEFGQPASLDDSSGAVDVTRLIESFQLGARNLQEIWGMILPPSTLVDLRRLARATPENFSISDELWARIVYDFALGHRLRTINRDHLLRAITPLYLGWVASYALELENSGPDEAEWRLEKLCLAWENAKPYFVSRWRWPDRFNA